MKKECEVSLHRNKILSIVKYIVFIFVFFMVGIMNSVKVEAESCDKTSKANCDTDYTEVTSDRI